VGRRRRRKGAPRGTSTAAATTSGTRRDGGGPLVRAAGAAATVIRTCHMLSAGGVSGGKQGDRVCVSYSSCLPGQCSCTTAHEGIRQGSQGGHGWLPCW
jgi:hypothetical protein